MTRAVMSTLLLVTLATGHASAQRSDDETEPVTDEETGPVTKEQLFDDPDAMTPGTNVFLDDVKVRSKSGNLMSVRVGRHEIFVAPLDPSMLEFVTVGAIVDVRGSLRETPSAEQAELIYATSDRAAERMARDRVYVDAWTVSTMP